MTRLALILLTLLAQRLLGSPGLPPWLAEPLLPAIWLIGPALADSEHRQLLPGLWLGLAWDVVLEPLIGPGAIAWSAAGLAVRATGNLLADRSPGVWVLLGALGAILVVGVRSLVELPLGDFHPFSVGHLLRATAFTGLWCGAVGWGLSLDLPGRWRRHRASRLR